MKKVVEILSDLDLKQVIEIQKDSLLDFSKIDESSYVDEINKKGFFIAPYSFDEFKKDKNKILLGIKEKDKVLAYIWISVVVDDHKYNKWINDEIKKEIFNRKIYKIKGIGVEKNKLDQGLGSKLLESLDNYLLDKSIKYLVSSIAFNPIKNLASLKFHKKLGFKKIAISPKVKYYGFDNYQCVLMAKLVRYN
jgi:GNAT superfamily N-acetyltransferase